MRTRTQSLTQQCMRAVTGLTLYSLLSLSAHAATIHVDSTADTVADDGRCTLREAIQNANTDDDVSGGDCTAGNGVDTIYLTSLTGTINISSELIIFSSVSIRGPGPEQLTLEGGNESRLISIDTSATQPGVEITSLALSGGNAGTSYYGGGIWNKGALSLTDCFMERNYGIYGGAILNQGLATINKCTFQNNFAFWAGGALLNLRGSNANIRNSVFSDNSAGFGGAVFIAEAQAQISNTTLSGNAASASGGAIVKSSQYKTDFANVTITDNEASSGGGIYNAGTGLFSIRNSIVAGNYADNDSDCTLANTLSSEGYNIFGATGACVGNSEDRFVDEAVLTASVLAPLADNGGDTLTHALIEAGGSNPAYEGGNPSGCVDHLGAPITTDQRGEPRTDRCDIGAFERAPDPHAQNADDCSDCHDGTQATGKPVDHPGTSLNCEQCHSIATPLSWFTCSSQDRDGAIDCMDHSETLRACSDCHYENNPNGYTSKADTPDVHIETTQECNICHTSNATWEAVSFDHNSNNAADDYCVDCHDGIAATGKSADHIDTTDQCEACHTPSRLLWLEVCADSGKANVGYDGDDAQQDCADHDEITNVSACSDCHVDIAAWQTEKDGVRLTAEAFEQASSAHRDTLGKECGECHDNAAASGDWSRPTGF